MFTFNDDSETDSEEIVSDSETSDDDEEINTQPTHSNSIANKEITQFDSEQSDWVIPDESNIILTEKKLKLKNGIALTTANLLISSTCTLHLNFMSSF